MTYVDFILLGWDGLPLPLLCITFFTLHCGHYHALHYILFTLCIALP
jgi:hypothetical protein